MRTIFFTITLAFLMSVPVLAQTPNDGEKQPVGRHLSDYVSTPKFGGYFIGKYAYSDQRGAHGGDGFSQRFIRAYVDGTILTDFKYRIQA